MYLIVRQGNEFTSHNPGSDKSSIQDFKLTHNKNTGSENIETCILVKPLHAHN